MLVLLCLLKITSFLATLNRAKFLDELLVPSSLATLDQFARAQKAQ
jgi:hypothetical protein